MKKHWAIALPLLVMGCQGPQDLDGDGIIDGVRSPDSVSVVAPSTPKGTVSGQVVNSRMDPMTDATVTLTLGSATTDAPVTTKTDAAGNFMFTGVPAGSQVLATISKQGFATMRISATVPSSAGNIPINNGNANIGAVALAETNATVRFTLVTPSGRPAVGAQAYAEALPAGSVTSNAGGSVSTSPVGTVAGSATAGNDGVVSFSNMPSGSELARINRGTGAGYRLWVDPVDINGDGIIDAAGTSITVAAEALTYGSRIVQLNSPTNSGSSGATGFDLLVSNVPSLAFASGKSGDPINNLLRGGEAIYVAFTHPVQKDSLLATITDEGGFNAGVATATPNATFDAYTLALPSTPSIQEGQKYNVLLRASSAYTGATLSWKGYFISGDVKTPRTSSASSLASVAFKDGSAGTAANNVLDNGECVIVTFNQVVVRPGATNSLEAFINADLNAATTLGVGEFGATSGFSVMPMAPPFFRANCIEEQVVYPVDTANFIYTPRYYFLATMAATVSVPTNTLVRLGFNKQFLAGGATYETAWATPLTQNVEVPLG